MASTTTANPLCITKLHIECPPIDHRIITRKVCERAKPRSGYIARVTGALSIDVTARLTRADLGVQALYRALAKRPGTNKSCDC